MRLLTLAALFVGFQTTATGDDAPKPPPEMLALEDMIGTWDEVTTTKASEWVPQAGKSTTVSKRTWGLGGKVIRGEGAWMPGKNEFLHLISYDPEAKAYRSWYFDSEGSAPRFVTKGSWDAKKRTLSYDDKDEAGNKWASTHALIGKDKSEWKLVVTSPTGTTLLDMSGTCTRRK